MNLSCRMKIIEGQNASLGRRQIKALIPSLPDAKSISPYLNRIDQSRYYSNFGPLYQELILRFAEAKGVNPDCVVGVSNATLGLYATLWAMNLKGCYVMVPGWTFIATAMAVRMAGLKPWFVDIDPISWALSPTRAQELLKWAPGPLAAILPVAPFGAQLPLDAWSDFAKNTGIPVVIDAATGFDALEVTDIPAVISLHATKALGIGEGGIVFCRDPNLIARIQKITNFGLEANRLSSCFGINAKLNEYSCAVGLAALDSWAETKRTLKALSQEYNTLLGNLFKFQPDFSKFAVNNCIIYHDRISIRLLAEWLNLNGIETIRWWPAPCPDHPAFAESEQTDITNARRISEQSIGLPLYASLNIDDIRYIADIVIKGMQQ